jgi:hypothetical protein
MKCNHQRSFKDRRAPRSVFGHYGYLGRLAKTELCDMAISASVSTGDHTNGKRDIAKDKRGAKKYVASRTRFHESMALTKFAQDEMHERQENHSQ